MTNDLSLSSVLSARTDLISTDLSATELVMLDLNEGAYFGMESVANTIWKSIAEPRTIAEVCDAVVGVYATTRAEVEDDTLSFLSELVEKGLVQVHEGAV